MGLFSLPRAENKKDQADHHDEKKQKLGGLQRPRRRFRQIQPVRLVETSLANVASFHLFKFNRLGRSLCASLDFQNWAASDEAGNVIETHEQSGDFSFQIPVSTCNAG
jgi:hypothetical protein